MSSRIVLDKMSTRMAPDGYTLLMGASGPLIVAKQLQPALAYDAERDFQPVALYGRLPRPLKDVAAVRTVWSFDGSYTDERAVKSANARSQCTGDEAGKTVRIHLACLKNHRLLHWSCTAGLFSSSPRSALANP